MGRAELRVVEGPDKGVSIELPLGGRVVLGRGEGVDLRLHDPAVSQRHCALEHRLAGVTVEDLGSARGTTLDGAAVRQGATLATCSAELRLGGTCVRLVLGEEPAPLPLIPGVRIIRRLGRGSSGSVFEGRLEGGRRVAVKLLALDADEVTRQRFVREAALCEGLVHPGIARVLQAFEADGRPCLVRELVEGCSLEERLRASGALPWTEAFALGASVAQALAHAHGRGVVHRDVKPANVMLDGRGGPPKLIDFDLAKRCSTVDRQSLTRLTASGEGLGSLSYLAPEQLDDARSVDPRADVYGLGVTLYHAISGRRPFEDVHPEAFLEALYAQGPTPIALLVPDLPAAARAVIERSIARKAADRHSSARALAEALTQAALMAG